MIVTGAVADPKIGPAPTNNSFVDLLWELDDAGWKRKQQNQPTRIIDRTVNLDVPMETSTTLSFQTKCYIKGVALRSEDLA
ncbi:MAG TPA: hypothetical protein VEG60_16775 [Candidatus Binatia bacterium]|nr:hypothetical protein [Candidatus Binatia bacterium]